AVKAIRAGDDRKGLAAVAILFLRAVGGAVARCDSISVGADAYLEKPVDPDQLIDFVESIAAARDD
ncbi:MAG: hypothetical protein ACTHJ3_14610, partial [Pararhizobium sp.]